MVSRTSRTPKPLNCRKICSNTWFCFNQFRSHLHLQFLLRFSSYEYMFLHLFHMYVSSYVSLYEYMFLHLNIRVWFTPSHPSKGENRTRNRSKSCTYKRALTVQSWTQNRDLLQSLQYSLTKSIRCSMLMTLITSIHVMQPKMPENDILAKPQLPWRQFFEVFI